jgi:hypothetical protein
LRGIAHSTFCFLVCCPLQPNNSQVARRRKRWPQGRALLLCPQWHPTTLDLDHYFLAFFL